jgi:hypothetical protein
MTNKMNTAADRDRRQRNGQVRGRDLYWGFTLGILSNLATIFMLHSSVGTMGWAMTAMIVGTFIFVMINSFDCMDDLKANADDMDEEEAATNFGYKFLNAPWGMFKGVVTLIFGALALTQLQVIWDIF